jgi:hypothetical protein
MVKGHKIIHQQVKVEGLEVDKCNKYKGFRENKSNVILLLNPAKILDCQML